MRGRFIRARSFGILLTGLILSGHVQADEPSHEELYRYGYDPRPDYVGFDHQYRQVHDRFSKELDELQADMIRQQRGGRKTLCTRQIFLECRWLVYYTDNQPRTRQRLDDRRKVLAQK